MSTARLTALRLVGFKSFAERTNIEFGPGISAVVGPNGSGKSNLADALRWTMGEQGRSLRTRRSEDVIFAGSSTRRAIGMADVTLVIDNGDGLLPLEYSEVEIGRRLYRSGENEYLLNRQRVRLRDLVDLLDAANLADNAFLFIGQGMVDQALALRPEERRPLFEEVAGVRRHERRRRHAETELAEAQANLERLRDVLAELRPQARRLAAQAEQLEARRTAGSELAEALVAAARSRWVESSRAASAQQQALDSARRDADEAMAQLRAAEELGEQLSGQMGERADHERTRRQDLDQLRSAMTVLRVDQARLLSELESTAAARHRVAETRQATEARMRDARRVLPQPLPAQEGAAAAELAELERELAEVEIRLSGLGRATDSATPAAAGRTADAERRLQRDARRVELEQARRRQAALTGELSAAQERAGALGSALTEAEADRARAVERLAGAVEALHAADGQADGARAALEAAAARQASLNAQLSAAGTEAAAAGALLASLDATIAAAAGSGVTSAARARGGALVAEGLEVDPDLRLAVAAALGHAVRAVAVDESSALALHGRPGTVLLPEAERRGRPPQAATDTVVSAATSAGGGHLPAAIRRDPGGHVTRLLARTVWVASLSAAIGMRGALGAGWRVVTSAGEVLTDDGVVAMSGPDPLLTQRAERDERARALERLESELVARRDEAERAATERASAAAAWDEARDALDEARRVLRMAEEGERAAQRRAENALRDATWEQSQVERLEREAASLGDTLGRLEAELGRLDSELGVVAGAQPAARGARATTARLETRRQELRARHDRLAAARAEADAVQRSAEEARRRAEVTLAIDEERMRELEAEAEALAGREAELGANRDRVATNLAAAEEREQSAAAALETLIGEGAADRTRLVDSERAAVAARERLRSAEVRSRTAEVGAMEARLHLEQVREQLLVELAGIGVDGLMALVQTRATERAPATAGDLSPDVLGSRLEEALDRTVETWEANGSDLAPPGPGRLTALRRRFHELGAGNPFAADEHREVSARLAAMETQRADLEAAIQTTRQLITDLANLITDQFRSTFAALEGAFGRTFEQLFGGGEAQLSLTAPDDLSSTGVEITARPPGKKRQPLAMLSGGERALTAVALLLAMLEVRPVPFCVLDEVDAALDEANIVRFAAALRGLADRIQFIVITHNRGTIEAADALYGVTLGDDAVSRIVSLRLPPARGNGHAAADLAAEATIP